MRLPTSDDRGLGSRRSAAAAPSRESAAAERPTPAGVLRKRRHLEVLIPRRPCALCGQPFDVLHMALAGRVWVCRPCLGGGGAASRARPDAGPDARARRERDVARLRRVEALVHYGGMGARMAAYAALAYLAGGSVLWRQLFTGVLVADVICRGIMAVLELPHRRVGLALEVALYAGVGHFWVGAGGSLALPDDLEGKAVTMLGFLAVFSLRSATLWWKLLHE